MKNFAFLLAPFAMAFAAPQLPPDSLENMTAPAKKETVSEAKPVSNAAGKAPAPAKSNGASLDALEAELNRTYQKVRNQAPVPEFYGEAKARIQSARRILQEKPKAEEISLAMKACSVWTRAAVLQMQSRERAAELAQLEAQRLKVSGELNKIYDQIIQLEKGNAARLQLALEEEQRKARERQDEAARRFDELQSALIQVKKDARGTIISMSDILFDVDKATLTGDLKTSLAKIAGILTIYKDADVMVEGHTDNTGSEEHNQKLSEKRAQNVMEFLVEQGLAQDRLQSMGYGLTKPIADNSTKEGRSKNRRVDLVVMEKKLQ